MIKDYFKGVGGVIIIIITFLVLSAGVWAFTVLTAEPKGRGDAIKQRESANNRIAAQERFEEMHQEILSADQRLTVLAEAVKDDPSYTNKQNLTGGKTYCLSVVADYNAEARKYTAAQFRAADLPAKIDPLDPATDCKEN